MPLNPLYIVASDIEQYYVDKDRGLPLSNGTLTFYRDTARNVPKQVFQLSGFPPNYTYTSMGVQITLSAVGTVQNSGGDNEVIYYYPYDADGNIDLYYIVVADQNGVVQFTREAWPNITQELNPIIDEFPIQNQFANPQFTEIFINDGFSTIYNVTSATDKVFPLGPNWDFVISGTGAVTVERIPISGNDKVITSPPYVLDVSITGGITACKMRQRFSTNSGLWASTPTNPIFLSGTLIAKNQSSGTTGIQMFYVESSGGSPVMIVDATFDNSNYSLLNGVTTNPVPLSNDTLGGPIAFVDVYISFLAGSHIRLSSLQVVPTSNPFSADFLQYDLNSSNREQALMGDYYLPPLKNRGGPNILTAWDFPLNPFQVTDTIFLASDPGYICDQTIALLGNTGNVTFSQTAPGALQFIGAGTNDSLYIMQYLEGAQAKKILGTELSVNIAAYKSPLNADDVIVRVYLFRGGATATIPILPASLGTLASDGTFTLTAANWTEIPRSNLDTAKAFLPGININNPDFDIKFSGWRLTDNTLINDTDKFAIVVTFNYMDTGTEIDIYSIGLTPNAVPCRPIVQTADEVLRECEYYYEKTYDITTAPGTVTSNGSRMYYQQHSLDPIIPAAYPRFWEVIYNIRKRIPVVAKIYSINGASGHVRVLLYDATVLIINADASIANWTLIGNGETGFHYQANDRATPIGVGAALGPYYEAVINYHWVADARLGIV